MKINEGAAYWDETGSGNCAYTAGFTDANDVLEYGFDPMTFDPNDKYVIRGECGTVCNAPDGTYKNCIGFLSPANAVVQKAKTQVKSNLKYILIIGLVITITWFLFKKSKK